MEDLENLKTLPFAQQLALIDAQFDARDGVLRLLEVAAHLRDHEPMSYLVRRLIQQGHLDDPHVAASLRALFVSLPDTGIQRLLKGIETLILTPCQSRVLVDCATAAICELPLNRLAATCLLDRWLKNTDAHQRSAMLAEGEEQCRKAIRSKTVDAVDDRLLARVPGTRRDALYAYAVAHDVGGAWVSRLKRFSNAVLDVLEAAPKSLSQANAESILSHQVYTDPGHFLIELLQNAEDSQASFWRVDISQNTVAAAHDGTPFDARDVVGVLSIGQTTKHKDQIGFFGVGFKSVYEICERPQVYSEPFCFEIADVSIPRKLGQRPADYPEGGTLVVLPLRDPLDPHRSPQQLFHRALAVPPQTLLTLHHIKRFSLTHGSQARTVDCSPGAAPGRITLAHLETGEEEHYLVETDDFERRPVIHDNQHSLGTGKQGDGNASQGPTDRGAHRTQRTPVLIAVALDATGCPCRFPPDAATIFSYLPTGEQSGLRFLLHAHFDLPVDRERLDLSSLWNRWAIGCAGELLARVAQRLVSEAERTRDELATGRIDAFLDVLPLPSDLHHPSYHGLIDTMSPLLRDIPILQAADGTRIVPHRAALAADPKVVEVLAEVSIDGDGRRLIAPVEGRKRELCRVLGVRPFGAMDIVVLLEANALETDPPTWLIPALPTLLESLGTSATPAEITRLATLPVLIDQDGRLTRPADVLRIPVELRWFYGGSRGILRDDLDLAPSLGHAQLWKWLDLCQLGFDDLIADLQHSDSVRRRVSTPEGIGRLLGYLRTAAEPHRIQQSGIAGWSLFPDQNGRPGPLCPQAPSKTENNEMGGPVWLAPAGPLGSYLRQMSNPGLRLIDATLQAEYETLLIELGASVMDLPLFLAQIRSGATALPADSVWSLYGLLDTLRDDLSDRIRQELARTPLFLDRQGTARPLCGEDAAWLPADQDIIDLSPSAPWVDGQLLERHLFLHTLGVETVGPPQLIDTLVANAESPLIRTNAPQWLRNAYAYLHARAPEIPPRLATRLATAPFWLDAEGQACPLGSLRHLPSHTPLVALYRAWRAFSFIDDALPESATELPTDSNTTALQLCQALRLDGELVRPDFTVLLDDLCHGAPVDANDDILRPLLIAALFAASEELSAAQLVPLRRAPIFRSESGQLLPLGQWGAAGFEACRRANAPLRAPLSLTDTQLLCEDDERELYGLLERLGAPSAGVEDLVRAIETDNRLRFPHAAALSRLALVCLKSELEAIHQEGPHRLSALALWPTSADGIASATQTYRPSVLTEILGEDWHTLLGEGLTVLDASAEDEANELAAYLKFADPVVLAIDRVRTEARPSAPLAQQPDFLNSRDKLANLLRVISSGMTTDQLATLPLSLNADGCVVVGPLFRATEDETELCRGLRIFGDLADAEWALLAGAVTNTLTPALPARRLVLALHDVCRETTSAATHPWLSDRRQRARLYQWLILRSAELERDETSRNTLGRTAVIITTQASLRPPRQLLFEADLPDLGLDWIAGEEVPPSLVQWLRKTYRLEDGQLEQILKHLLEAHTVAVENADGQRSLELLRYMASSLGGLGEVGQHVRRLPKSLKLHHQLLIESMEGKFARPKQLFLPDAQDWTLLETFCAEVPLRVAKKYVQEPAVSELLESLGAKRTLGTGRLQALLAGSGKHPGLPANLAFAQYVTRRVASRPALVAELRLDRIAWIPNGQGELCLPGDLYNPTERVLAVLGDQPGFIPHPEFFYDLAEDTVDALPFCTLESAKLSTVVEHLTQAGEAPPEVLAWLESAIRDRRVDVTEVRLRLWDEPFIIDDRGDLRPPAQLMRDPPADIFGHRRSTWNGAREYPRLADALKVLRTSGTREVLRFLEEIATDLADLARQGLTGEALLDDEPELAHCLPRSLGVLARGKARPPAVLPLVVSDGSARTTLIALASGAEAQVALPDPPELAFAIEARRGASPDFDGPLFPLIVEESRELIIGYLTERVGIQTLGQIWRPLPLPKRLARDCTADYAARATSLGIAITELMRLVPRLRATLRHIPQHAWNRQIDALQVRWDVRVVETLSVSGQLGEGPSLDVERDMASEPGRLILTSSTVNNTDEIAEYLCRAVLLDGRSDEALFDTVRALVDCTTGDQMKALLDGLGFRTPTETTPIGGGRRARQAAAKEAAMLATDDTTDAPTLPVVPSGASETPPSPPTEGLMAKLRNWWKGSPEGSPESKPEDPPRQAPKPAEDPLPRRPKEKPDRPPTAGKSPRRPKRPAVPSAAEHASWFQPKISVGPQLDPRDPPSKKNRPDFGLSFAPHPLPSPFLYGPQQIMNHFDPSNQRWASVGLRPDWCSAASSDDADETGQLVLRGRLPAGQATLPLPLFSQLGKLETTKTARTIVSRTGQILLLADQATELHYNVRLGPLPNFEAVRDAAEPPSLLFDLTTPDEDLPNEVHDFLADLRGEALPVVNRSVTIRDFIRQNYTYDPAYLEDPHVARWLRSISRGRMNAHLAALHAGRDARSLGRGVCYELNILACELLRRSGIPAGIATGWTFDRGSIAEPDHLWAMALINTDQGLRWYPIDASTTREGRPLHFGDRPPGPWRVKSPAKRAMPSIPNPKAKSLPRRRRQDRLPTADLMRVAKHLQTLSGVQFVDGAALDRRCRQILSDPQEAQALLDVLMQADGDTPGGS